VILSGRRAEPHPSARNWRGRRTARLARLHAVLAPRLETVFACFGVRGADFALLATLVRLAAESVSEVLADPGARCGCYIAIAS